MVLVVWKVVLKWFLSEFKWLGLEQVVLLLLLLLLLLFIFLLCFIGV